MCAFLDIGDAFDNTLHAEIQNALIHKGIRIALAFWLNKMFQNSNKYQAYSYEHPLSSLMRSKLVDKLWEELANIRIKVQVYASLRFTIMF